MLRLHRRLLLLLGAFIVHSIHQFRNSLEDNRNNHTHDISSSSDFLVGKNDSVTHQNEVEMKLTNTTTKSNDNDTQVAHTHMHMHYNEPNFTLSNMTRDIVYLHVGKTGGISLDKVLKSNCDDKKNKGALKSCIQALPGTNYRAALSNLTTTTVHVSTNRLKNFKMKSATSYLFTIRNPISRIVSAFNMCHPDNNPRSRTQWRESLFYHECFPTIEDLATFLRKNETKEVTMINVQEYAKVKRFNVTFDCLDLGKRIVEGTLPGHTCHFYENYAHYANLSSMKYPDKEILVLRTESLWNDVLTLEKALRRSSVNLTDKSMSTSDNPTATAALLSKTFENAMGHKHSHGSEAYTVTSGLSKEGKEIICCQLSKDIQIFEDLVRKSVNLNESEKEDYLNVLYADCGIERNDDELSRSFAWSSWRAESKIC